jgi:hypothetical protein
MQFRARVRCLAFIGLVVPTDRYCTRGDLHSLWRVAHPSPGQFVQIILALLLSPSLSYQFLLNPFFF